MDSIFESTFEVRSLYGLKRAGIHPSQIIKDRFGISHLLPWFILVCPINSEPSLVLHQKRDKRLGKEGVGFSLINFF